MATAPPGKKLSNVAKRSIHIEVDRQSVRDISLTLTRQRTLRKGVTWPVDWPAKMVHYGQQQTGTNKHNYCKFPGTWFFESYGEQASVCPKQKLLQTHFAETLEISLMFFLKKKQKHSTAQYIFEAFSICSLKKKKNATQTGFVMRLDNRWELWPPVWK